MNKENCKSFDVCEENCRNCNPIESPCFKILKDEDRYKKVFEFLYATIMKTIKEDNVVDILHVIELAKDDIKTAYKLVKNGGHKNEM